jgi:hypothetical protein
MRCLRMCLFALTVATATAMAANVDFVRVWPAYRDADSFMGIGEYFGGKEPTGGRLILRSQPDQRGGFYWLTRLRVDQPVEAVVELSLIRGDAPEPRLQRFPATLRAGSQAVLLGLTGDDWPQARERPVAWRLRVLAADTDQVLAEEKSFLWALPDGS